MSKTIILKNGSKYKVIEENGKYYICERTQFRKSSSMIAEVREDVTPVSSVIETEHTEEECNTPEAIEDFDIEMPEEDHPKKKHSKKKKEQKEEMEG